MKRFALSNTLGLAVIFFIASLFAGQAAPQRIAGADGYNAKAFGAKGDGKTLDTEAINKAIETAASTRGRCADLRPDERRRL